MTGKKELFEMLASALLVLIAVSSTAIGEPADVQVPHIESVVPLPRQPQEDDSATVWYDNFNGPEKLAYAEGAGNLDDHESLGGAPGKSLACIYEKGSQGRGGRKLFFGDSPAYGNKVVRKGEKFGEIYWRIYVKHQFGWTGGGEAKLSRATSLVSEDWKQAMIAHVWSGAGDSLTLDPASGVRGDRVVTTKYNDFDKLHWLGNSPASNFTFSSAEQSGWWVCVESYARLNTPGQKDGLNQLWIDGHLEAERKNLNWRGSYTEHGINAVFLEAYWNQGSPVTQTRWLDNFVVSTRPIGPVVCPLNPVLIKAPHHGPGKLADWEVELAQDRGGDHVVWKSRPIPDDSEVHVGDSTGLFVGALEGKSELTDGATYYCRVRQRSVGADGGSATSPWSPWHQSFKVAKAESANHHS